MGFVMMGLTVFMLAPLALVAWYYARHKPAVARRLQEQTWQPLADRLGARWIPSPGGSTHHMFTTTAGATQVTALVFHRIAVDRAVAHEVGRGDPGGWRTFVQASVVGGVAPAALITPRYRAGGAPIGDAAFQQAHATRPLHRTPPEAIAARLTPSVAHAFAVLGPRYTALVAGPGFVSLQLPGVCSDPQLLEAAVHVVGMFAQPDPRLAAA